MTTPSTTARWRRLLAHPATGRLGIAVAILATVAVAAVTLPALPSFTPWPALLGLLPWTIGKYVLCPLRWHALSESGRPRSWHAAAYAESELLGLLTPGHVGADLWRIRRLARAGMPRLSAVAEVALDRFVGAVGLALFVGFAATALPLRMAVSAACLLAAAVVLLLLLRRFRPAWVPQRKLPAPGQLVRGLLLSVGYQASIVALLVGTLAATGQSVPPLAVLGAFGASQLAGAVPGPNGASPRDAALVVALFALGVPWPAALGAVSLKALLAWAPALLLGGSCLLFARRRSAGAEPAGG